MFDFSTSFESFTVRLPLKFQVNTVYDFSLSLVNPLVLSLIDPVVPGPSSQTRGRPWDREESAPNISQFQENGEEGVCGKKE